MSDKKPFSLHFLSEQGSPGQTSYNTLAEAINAYQSMWDGTDFSILSLKFDGEIIADDEALTDLLPSWKPGDGVDLRGDPPLPYKDTEVSA